MIFKLLDENPMHSRHKSVRFARMNQRPAANRRTEAGMLEQEALEDELKDYEEAYDLSLSPRRTMTVLLPREVLDEVEASHPIVRMAKRTTIFSRAALRTRVWLKRRAS